MIIGYSNFVILLSLMNTWEELKTNILDTRINVLIKLVKGSLIKLSEKIFAVPTSLLYIVNIVIRRISKDSLVIKL